LTRLQLVGTRKGAFVLTSDGKREQWDVSGPHFRRLGDLPLKGSPADPEPLYASQSSGWFGQLIQRSDDGGKTWEPVGNKFAYDGVPGTHQWYDGTPHPWEFKRVWHLEPSLTDPDTSTPAWKTPPVPLHRRRPDLAGTFRPARPRHRPRWQPGAGGMCLHTIILDPAIRSASSSPSRPRAPSAPTTAAKTWKPINRGLYSEYIPDPTAEVGHCVHHIAMHPSRPDVLFMQKHWDVMRSDDAGDSWREVSGNLPTDFGFAIDVHAHEPETIYVVPIKSDSEHYPPEGKLRVYRSRTGGNEWEPLTKGLPQSDCYVNVLRDAMAVDSLDSCGVYFGTTGGQVYARPMPATTGRPSSAIFRPCFRSRCRRCHDPGRAAGASAHAGARRRRGASSKSPARSRSARSSTRWRRAIRCCAGPSAITSRNSAGPFVRFFACEEDLSHEAAGRPAARRGRSLFSSSAPSPVVRFSQGKVIADDPRADAGEIGRPGETYRRVRIASLFGNMQVLVTDGHLPYPFGYEVMGYQVSDLAATLEKAKASGAKILSPPYSAGDRTTAIVEFPGGYIAEIHAPAAH
jgi:hypothetical protein